MADFCDYGNDLWVSYMAGNFFTSSKLHTL